MHTDTQTHTRMHTYTHACLFMHAWTHARTRIHTHIHSTLIYYNTHSITLVSEKLTPWVWKTFSRTGGWSSRVDLQQVTRCSTILTLDTLKQVTSPTQMKTQQQFSLKVNCRGKSPMHIIVWICLFGHAMHKTTLLIISLWWIFEILSHFRTLK